MKRSLAAEFTWWVIAFELLLPAVACPQCPSAPLPSSIKDFCFYYADGRAWYEPLLNRIQLTTKDVGRSVALIAGVTRYPELPNSADRYLQSAEVDIDTLEKYLRDEEFFDEIFVLRDSNVTYENLHYFLETYFPSQLQHSPHSRFLFAYSGHGFSEGSGDTARGFLLLSAATSKDEDTKDAISMSVLRDMLGPVIDSATQVLVLINACDSGLFLKKPFGRAMPPFDPAVKGAHAIVASESGQKSWGNPKGPSVFFEKVLAGLGGSADANRDCVVTYYELYDYLYDQVRIATYGAQTPQEGDISRDGSNGGFYFLHRDFSVKRNVPAGPPTGDHFGPPARETLTLSVWIPGHDDGDSKMIVMAVPK